jgi:tRNA(Ile)-lysidine synthase
MSGPHPAVAEVRRAVRYSLRNLGRGSTVLVAVSGGADSMALAAATVFEGRAAGWQVAAVVVDHQLQRGSAEVAERVRATLEQLGVHQVIVQTVSVGSDGGPEAAARDARYEAIDRAAESLSADAVLLGHTRDDQAETVLLGLARGSGARSLCGMAPGRGRYRRPLLDVLRTTTRAACVAESLPTWDDPHNTDPSFARVRVRDQVLPTMEEALGPGVRDALARTADLLRDDDAALEQWAHAVLGEAREGAGDLTLAVEVLAAAPAAVRRRALRINALDAGVPGGRLRAGHLRDLDALVADWSGQGEVHLPGGVRARRTCGRLLFAPSAGAQER